MSNKVSLGDRSWHSLYTEAELTYELDTSANESDDESNDESSYDSDSLDNNDILPESIKYDASGVDFEKYVEEQALAKAREDLIKRERFAYTYICYLCLRVFVINLIFLYV